MDKFDIQEYILDFERIKEITDNGLIIKDKTESDMFPKIECLNINTEVIKKYITYFNGYFKDGVHSSILIRSEPNAKRDNNYTFFIIETLIYNKILIKKRLHKIEKILNGEKND